ncbi:beta-ketoacyl-[acyl-carrier-protein] synthase family protein [Bacteroides thetaiotaomicron]|nr:beta-ketoacyl-[acyl-carrier-protein] synthase family protein [Bacteroides thetaiotaomicron]
MNIAITGEGIVSAIGLNKQEVLQALQEGRTGIGEMKYLQSIHHELPVGEVDLSNEQMKKMLGIPSEQMMSRTSLLGMLAIDQALKEAYVNVASLRARKADGKPLRIVLVSGTTVGGMDITELCFDQLEKQKSVEFLQHHDCGNSTRLMADHFGIFDEVATLSTACSSAANAIMLGARLLKAGEADLVVAGGTEALSRFHLNGFNSLMILDHESCRPFDTTRAGLNLGEGAAFLVLESEEMAQQRKITPHAYLTGYGNACDAFHQTASSENGEGAYLAMTEALAMAHLSAKDIQYVNAHGTGTPNNDQSESVSLKRVFGDEMPMVSSTKSFTGHTTSASGSIETVICILAMQHHFVPANLGWKNPMENGILPTMGAQNLDLENVLCNSFGFGGNDSSLVISLHPKESASEIMRDVKIKVLSKVEINSEEQLTDIRKYVKPLEVRRMGKIMKSSLLSSLVALQRAGIEVPDSIITGTAYGCLENSERLMEQIKEEGEGMLKPTFFMQSTHNTIGSNIAIKTHCHGYNVTYTQESHSLEWAIRDAELLLRSGKVKNVLVGCHDESTPLFNTLLEKGGEKPLPSIHSIAMVLSCGE